MAIYTNEELKSRAVEAAAKIERQAVEAAAKIESQAVEIAMALNSQAVQIADKLINSAAKRARELIEEASGDAKVLIEEAVEVAKVLRSRIKHLEGIVPICSYCKSIRDDVNVWHQLEAYISEYTDAKFSHGICPHCYKKQIEDGE